MTTYTHPLKGEFDTANATWQTVPGGTLEVGNADNGLVALHQPETGKLLIFTPAEWDAFCDGVTHHEFDIDTLTEHAIPDTAA